ncbi:hypothetical protein Tsubulata_044773 [Turnera subulata]|uniref:RING-type E3 ubiquitin transferase n=1 Tax=Turnera subulata TaxID=218843 RepID=A0A9Q0JQ97_9ROSI|nr:hypothetical protein Tsubulata_044773 [Turnera subulata]
MNLQPLPPPFSVSAPYSNLNHEEESSSPSSTNNRISPVLLLAIIVLAVIFFISGLLHLLFRFVRKRTPFSTIYHSNRFPESSGSQSLQRQLQQLFRMHDSGLDQSMVEALPVFYYRDIVGLKEPFDCAVCLCEFSGHEKLRLLPMCSHAFHIDCIDTWLLSNSTCPLCRGSLVGSDPSLENHPWFGFHVPREASNGSNGGNGSSHGDQNPIMEEGLSAKRLLSVRLGKFRSLNQGEGSGGDKREEESSGRNLDDRRCYSMGTVEYVEGDSNLQVAFFHGNVNGRGENACTSSVDGGDLEGKKIRGRTRGDSFSVSKIWLWSKKSRFPNSSSGIILLTTSLASF